MSPDSAESRLRILEQDVSALKQQVSDTVEDVRVFSPLIATQSEMRATLAHLVADLSSMRVQIAHLEERIAEETRLRKEQHEQDRREREQGQQDRAKEDRTNRTLLWVAAIGLVGTLLLAIAAVGAALVG
jgi:regulator of replication initiation timing